MGKLFNLSIVTPGKILYEGKVSSLVAPSEIGYFGILADHMPFIASLVNGKIILRDDFNKIHVLNSQRGFIEVIKNTATILFNREI